MIGFTIISIIVGTLVIAAIPNLIWLLAYLTGKYAGFSVQYTWFGWTTALLIVILWGCLIYGYSSGRLKYEVKSIEYKHHTIPESFDGYKIVHISDLHLSTFDNNKNHLEKIVDEINHINPDLICFTGDLINNAPQEAMGFTNIMNKLSASDGVVSVLGNHDFMLYSHDGKSKAEKEAAVGQLVDIQENKFGWKVLRNSHLAIERGKDTLYIIGVDNTSCKGQGFKTINKGDLKAAMDGTEGFRILLSHDPSHWTGEVVPDTDIQLTLSGHTHAAQFSIFGWTPASWVFDQTQGRYDKDGQTLYVNIGLGCTLPFRIGATPEITVITLRR